MRLFSKHFTGIIIGFLIICCWQNVNSQYCIPNPTYGTMYGTYIEGVNFGEVYNQESGDSAGPNYTYYSNLPTTYFVRGSNYTIYLHGGPYYANMHYVVWIDYNHDNDFYDTGEKLYEFTTTSTYEYFNFTFEVPVAALIGDTRLRIRCVYNTTNPDPCTNYTYGETEDYNVSITNFTDVNLGFKTEYSSYKFFNHNNDVDLDIIEYNTSYGQDTSVFFYRDLGTYFQKYNYMADPLVPLIDIPEFTIDDLNNDNYLDVIFMGEDRTSDQPYTLIYEHSGSLLAYVPTSITQLARGSIAAADFNNDGRKDLIITGEDVNGDYQTLIYENNITDFTLKATLIPAVRGGGIKYADYDSDGDIDFLLVGFDKYSTKHTKIFRNDGNWQFTDIMAQIPQMFACIADWGDYDSDGDMDLVMQAPSDLRVYKNNGENNFESIEIFASYIGGIIRWADMNNDGLLDVVCDNDNNILILLNQGDDTFVQKKLFLPNLGNEYNYLDIGDFDNDNKLDILVNSDSLRVLQNNTTNANLRPTAPTILNAVPGRPEYYAVTLSWNSATDDLTPKEGLTYNLRIGTSSGGSDILSPTSTNTNMLIPRFGNVYSDTSWVIYNLEPGTYYWSVQAVDNSFLVSNYSAQGSFQIYPPLTPTSFFANGAYPSDVSGFDYDLDNDIDVLINYSGSTNIYEQTTSMNFTPKVISSGLTIRGLCDINTDNRPDLLFSTASSFGYLINNSDKTFSQVSLDTMTTWSATVNDFDNDGDQDILTYYSKYYLYVNNGSESFTRINLPLTDTLSSITLSSLDIDNDGDFDFIISGTGNDNPFGYGESPGKTFIYKNNGNLNFTLSQSLFPGLGGSRVMLSGFAYTMFPPNIKLNDYNFDGYIDLLVTGRDVFANNYSIIYLNNGHGNFEQLESNLRPTSVYQANWFDYNADGFIDIMLPRIGSDIDNIIYLNNKNETYEGFSTSIDSLSRIFNVDFIDVNGDNQQDAIYTLKYVIVDNYRFETYIEKNTGNLLNNSPGAPENLESELDSFTVNLRWDKGIDDLTGSGGSTYNVWVGTSKNNPDIVSPLSNITTGRSWYNKPGNCGTNTGYIINNLPVGTYYWAVQTVDNGYNAGLWSEIDSFIVSTINVDFNYSLACSGTPTTFTDNTAISGGDTLKSWFWDFGDGETSTLQNPTHTFTEGGLHNVKLTVVSELTVQTDSIEVMVNYTPVADFIADPVCNGDFTGFIDQSETTHVTVSSYIWNFGDTKTNNTIGSIEYRYALPGNYTASLSITALTGCVASTSKTVIVAPKPPAEIAFQKGYTNIVCEGGFTILKPKYPSSNYNYYWMIDTVYISDETKDSLVVKHEGNYKIQIFNSVGTLVCSDTSFPQKITFIPPPAEAPELADVPTNICPFDMVLMEITNYNEYYDYDWLRNGSYIGSNIDTLHRILSVGEYKVVASINHQCPISSDIVNINFISNIKKPELKIFGPNVWYIGCKDTLGLKYRWFYNGNVLEDETDYICMADQNLGEYQLETTDNTGCTALSDIVTIPAPEGTFKNISGLNLPTRILIYPNPSDGRFYADLSSTYAGNVVINIYNMQGKLVYTEVFNKDHQTVKKEISPGLKNGLYAIHILMDGISHVEHVIVE